LEAYASCPRLLCNLIECFRLMSVINYGIQCFIVGEEVFQMRM